MSQKAENILFFASLAILTVMGIIFSKKIIKKILPTDGKSISLNKISKILIVGDSITVRANTYQQGYITMLKKLFPNLQIDVVARVAMSTDWMLANAKSKIDNGGYDLLIIMGGTNDIYSGRTIKSCEANLQAIFNAAQAAGTKVMAITPPPSGNSPLWSSAKQAFHIALNNFILNNSSVDYAVDYYTLISDKSNVGKPLAGTIDTIDGIHPSPLGNLILANYITKKYFSN